MAKSDAKIKSNEIDLIGQKIGGIICDSFIEFGDAVLIISASGHQKLYFQDSIKNQSKEYKIDGQKVEKIECSEDLSLFILQTSDKTYYRDRSNQDIPNSGEWIDHYLEPFTSSFFRKDNRGNWYDIQGYLLRTPIFIKDQVLCSLIGKTSKTSLFFKDQSLFINTKCTMVQVGKVVYDMHLNILNYFGEKITGIGPSNISFAPNFSIQEIHLGLMKRAFINEQTYEPYTINGAEITTHRSTLKKGKYTFEVFRSNENEFIVYNNLNQVLQYQNKALSIEIDSYLSIGQFDIIKVYHEDRHFYLDLESKLPFDPLKNGEFITEIDLSPINIENETLYNFTTSNKSIVYNSSENKVLAIGKEKLLPEKISIAKGFEKRFYYATFEGVTKLCSHKHNEIIKVENNSIEISKLLHDSEQKLVNVMTTDNHHLVLDFRHDNDDLKLAKCGTNRIKESLGKPTSIGNNILQNVRIETLGGTKDRVVNLNDPDLSVFHLPDDLKAYSEQSNPSIFAGNVMTQIDFINSIQIGDKLFYNGTFLNYLDEPKSVIIQQENARPLQLDGVGHRNELVQHIDTSTISTKYFLSEHRIIGVVSLTEDLKDSQLLFSFNTMSSWLPFYDTYLPIFKRIKDFEGLQHWEYHLFELHNISKEKEYIAVEQKPPYRILVDKSKNKYKLRIVKSKELILKSPEEISAIRRFFSDPGYLIDVG